MNPPLFAREIIDDGRNGLLAYSTEITLRDLFAAACIGAVFADAQDDKRNIKNEAVARAAYQIADCMLAERAK